MIEVSHIEVWGWEHTVRGMRNPLNSAVTMIKQRAGHKLDEWNEFVKILKDLPYLEEICKED